MILGGNAIIAATELIHALRNLLLAAPNAHIGDAKMQALEQLAEIFQRAMVQPQQQVPTEASKNLPVSPPRVAPKLSRVNINPITATPNQSENRAHTLPPYTPTPSRAEQINHQQEATNALPLKPKIPPISAPKTHQYPLRHPRQQEPAVSSAWYANAAKHIYNLEANAVLNPLTGVIQEFIHLIKGPDKDIWTKYLAN